MRCESISLIVCSTRSPSRPSVKQAARRSNSLIFPSVCRNSSAPPSLDTWPAVESRKSNAYDLGMAAFARKASARPTTAPWKLRRKKNAAWQPYRRNGRRVLVASSAINRLAGSAGYDALDFSKAEDAIPKSPRPCFPEQAKRAMGRTRVLLGNARKRAVSCSESAAIYAHEKSARKAYQAALTVSTREQRSSDWAATQSNLGIMLNEMAGRTEMAQASQYLQHALDAFRSALQVRTREQLLQDWATTQN